jgi:TetR/AcrR family transcriptional repressor of multidrug resistance operon
VVTHPPPRSQTSPHKKRDPKNTRDRLVRAALELFTTKGYHASTTPLIAARAGVAEGTIYRHFTSKEHLLNEIYRAGVRLFSRYVKEAPPDRSCREHLHHVARAWQDLAARDPGLVGLVFGNGFTGLLDEQSRSLRREMRANLEQVVASGKASGEVRAGAVETWTDVWLHLIILVMQRIANQRWQPDDSAVRHVVDGAWDAIGAPSPKVLGRQEETNP